MVWDWDFGMYWVKNRGSNWCYLNRKQERGKTIIWSLRSGSNETKECGYLGVGKGCKGSLDRGKQNFGANEETEEKWKVNSNSNQVKALERGRRRRGKSGKTMTIWHCYWLDNNEMCQSQSKSQNHNQHCN